MQNGRQQKRQPRRVVCTLGTKIFLERNYEEFNTQKAM